MTTYRISTRYRIFIRLFCVIGAAIAAVALTTGPLSFRTDSYYRLGAAVVFSGLAGYLALYDYFVLGRRIETDDAGIHFFRRRGTSLSLSWPEITRVVNRSRYAHIYIESRSGGAPISHHFEDVEHLIAELENRTQLQMQTE